MSESNWDSLSFKEQEALQDKKIRTFIQEIAKYHPYYKKLMKQENIDPSSINSIDDFIKKFPLTSKIDIAPIKENPYIPDYFIMQKEDEGYRPTFMIATTGRTAFSTPFWFTNWDLENIMMVVAKRVVEVTGMRKDDVVINSFPYSPHLAFWFVYYATTGLGLTAIHTGGGKILGTQRIVGITYGLKGSVFIGVPGYIQHVIRSAQADERHFDNIRLLITGGDRCTRTFRKRIVGMLNEMNAPNPTVCAAYGFTESKRAPVECPHPEGVDGELTGYHTYPDMELWYCIDPKTGERLGPEEKGELVWTGLYGRGTVVLNYRTGDIAEEGIKYEKCPYCGRNVPLISSMISRVSEQKDFRFDKVKGTLVDLNKFFSLMPEVEEIEEWQIIIMEKDGLDHLVLNVNPKRAILNKKKKIAELQEKVMKKIRDEMEISPNQVNILSLDEITRSLGMESQLKERRILDIRPR